MCALCVLAMHLQRTDSAKRNRKGKTIKNVYDKWIALNLQAQCVCVFVRSFFAHDVFLPYGKKCTYKCMFSG